MIHEIFAAFAAHLRNDPPTRTVRVLEPRWDPTYGEQDPGETDIEVVDMDKLIRAIDEFAAELKARSTPEIVHEVGHRTTSTVHSTSI